MTHRTLIVFSVGPIYKRTDVGDRALVEGCGS